MLSDLKEQLIISIKTSLQDIYPAVDHSFPIHLETPHDKSHGDISCNVALKLAGVLKKNPLELAASIVNVLEKTMRAGAFKEKIEKVEVKKPGFINFFLTLHSLYEVLSSVLQEGENYGRSHFGNGEKVQIEFVSANPTGPLTVAHARQAAVGDALGNILGFLGFKVTKEYYVNDEGNQIKTLGASIRIRAQQCYTQREDPGEAMYQGEYIKDIAQKYVTEHGITKEDDLLGKDLEIEQYGVQYLLSEIKKDLEDFGVQFNVWSYQSKVALRERVQSVLALLEEKGFIYHTDGALWFKSTAFGDDKDRVVKKSDGTFTYLTPDIVYHKDKFERGFHKVFNIWGPDHHGYIPRIKAVVQALGHDPKALEVLIVQLATIFKNGKPLSMSTRRGEFITLREVIGEVGKDAARFFFLMRHINAHLDFDLELAKKETPENPVYYIQYAHARIHSIIHRAREARIIFKQVQFLVLKEPEEIDLIKTIGYFPEALLTCCNQRDPYALGVYLQELATDFHRFYDCHRVLDQEGDLTKERLALVEAARIVLANGLCLLGVSVPEKM